MYQYGPRASAHQLKLNRGGRGWWYRVARGSSVRDGPISMSRTLRTPRRIAPAVPTTTRHTLAIVLTTPLLPLPLRLPRLRSEPGEDAPQAPADCDGGRQLSSPRSAGRWRRCPPGGRGGNGLLRPVCARADGRCAWP